jgi:hypothetical protein
MNFQKVVDVVNVNKGKIRCEMDLSDVTGTSKIGIICSISIVFARC